jgi:hypothetical protein
MEKMAYSAREQAYGIQRNEAPTCGCIITFRGDVVGCDPTAAGPRGLARWRNESASTILFLLNSFDF